MEIILFTIVGVAVYFASDQILLFIENKRGKPFPNRSIVYFFIFFILIVVSFELIQRLMVTPSPISQ